MRIGETMAAGALMFLDVRSLEQEIAHREGELEALREEYQEREGKDAHTLQMELVKWLIVENKEGKLREAICEFVAAPNEGRGLDEGDLWEAITRDAVSNGPLEAGFIDEMFADYSAMLLAFMKILHEDIPE